MHLRTRIVARALPLLLSAAPAFAADCPTNIGRMGASCQDHLHTSTAPIFSFTPPSGCVGQGGGTISYNLIAGSIAASAFLNDHFALTNSMQTSDVFVITGPASATAIDIQAILTTVRQPWTLARLTVGAVTLETSAPGSGTEVLKLNAAYLPGEPFTVGMFVEATAVGIDNRQISGSLAFSKLPPGYTLTSCQGYAAAPVATRVTSWGRLKQIYR